MKFEAEGSRTLRNSVNADVGPRTLLFERLMAVLKRGENSRFCFFLVHDDSDAFPSRGAAVVARAVLLIGNGMFDSSTH